jgi:hypothetical protein
MLRSVYEDIKDIGPVLSSLSLKMRFLALVHAAGEMSLETTTLSSGYLPNSRV